MAEQSRWGRARAWLAARSLGQLLAGTGVLALGATAPFGGWQAVPPPAVQDVDPGRPMTVGPVELTVDKVLVSPQPTKALLPLTGSDYVIVLGTVRVTGTESVNMDVLGYLLHIEGVGNLRRTLLDERIGVDPATARPTVFSSEDSSELSVLGPGMTYPVGFAFARPRSASEIPPSVDVLVRTFTYRRGNLSREMTWVDEETDSYRVVTAVTERGAYDPTKAPS